VSLLLLPLPPSITTTLGQTKSSENYYKFIRGGRKHRRENFRAGKIGLGFCSLLLAYLCSYPRAFWRHVCCYSTFYSPKKHWQHYIFLFFVTSNLSENELIAVISGLVATSFTGVQALHGLHLLLLRRCWGIYEYVYRLADYKSLKIIVRYCLFNHIAGTAFWEIA